MKIEDKDTYYNTKINGIDFSKSCIEKKEFDCCIFENCNFSDAIFKHCHFNDCEFINCNLSMLKIEYSDFIEVSFVRSKLIGIDWSRVAWPHFIFTSPIKFYQCILNDSSFHALILPEIVIEECSAQHVDFREADLNNANFTATDFNGSLFNKTILNNADFSDAFNYQINILENTIKKAKFSRFEALSLLNSLDIELVD